MERNILKCVESIDDFSIDEFNKLNIGVEIQDFTEPNLTNEQINEVVNRYKKMFKDFKHAKALHGPFLDLKPSSPDLDIRRVSFNKYLRTMKIAIELDVDYVIFHSKIIPWLNEPSIVKLNYLQTREFWESLLMEVDDFKGNIVLENVFEKTPEMLKELISVIDIPKIKVNLDIGHARLGTASLEKWIKELKDYLVYIHLHSNDGLYDLHSEPSEFQINAINSLLNKYNLNPVISLEYKSNNIEKHINTIRNF